MTARCPHCRTIAAIDVEAGLGACCVCGGARIAIGDAVTTLSGAELPHLKVAESVRISATLWWIAAWASALLSGLLGLSTLIVLGAFHAASPLLTAGFAGAAFWGALATWLFQRARQARRSRSSALERARACAATDVVKSHGGDVDSAEFAQILGLTQEQALLLLAELNLGEFLRPVADRGEPATRIAAESGDPGGADEAPALARSRERS
jgi:hypothetical protein